jgi:hypothetical protein
MGLNTNTSFVQNKPHLNNTESGLECCVFEETVSGLSSSGSIYLDPSSLLLPQNDRSLNLIWV